LDIIVKDGHESIEDALDAALEMTFPASDPIALFIQEDDASNDARLREQRAAGNDAAMPLNRKA